MNKNNIKYFTNSFIWGTLTKILDAGLNFISIPLLLKYFGKEDYGLLALAIATNAYMALLNMGMNTGSVKYFSQWIATKQKSLLEKVTRTSITFYLSIGLINCIVLIVLAYLGNDFFSIKSTQIKSFEQLLLILAFFSIFNWASFVFTQLLIADEKISFTQKILCFRSVFQFILVLCVYYFKLNIITYFFFRIGINALIIIPYYIFCYKLDLIKSFLPGFYWKEFRIVFKYSMAIFAMSLFQFTATQSRPLILGMFSNQGTGILTEYKVIEVFPVFIISIGGILTSILLPKTSKAIHNKDKGTIENIAYTGTKYTSIIISFLCFPVILCAKDLLTAYVGEEYAYLSKWLIIWSSTLILMLHNSPVASLVLATGKTKALVISSAIACIISIVINWFFVQMLGVGSAVIGYLIYVIMQVSFYYLYFNPKILKLNSQIIFKSFFTPVLLASVIAIGLSYLIPNITNLYLLIFLKSSAWCIIFSIFLIWMKIIKFKTIKLSILQIV